ncbi:thioesterase II family protein [Hyphococcus lacteus]|uniref:Alpha/beta fold hydrolase n=1 Tax=Hyphococcus lacteus TaxID=3143536 RepID=A0ABV3Z3V6_9PROT
MSEIILKCLEPRPMAIARLMLIPFAGGGASVFRHWAKAFPAHIEVFALQLPGREDRINTPPFTDWTEMIGSCHAAMARWPKLPIAFYGHSLGAVIALELARTVATESPERLQHLFCAARPWPGKSYPIEQPDIDSLDDDEFLSVMNERYGTLHPSFEIDEIRELTLPSLRSDLKLLNSYNYNRNQPLPSPLTVYSGVADPITSIAPLNDWQSETTSNFTSRSFSGGHFFLETCRDELLHDMVQKLTQS